MTKFGQERLPHERVEWLGFSSSQFIQFEMALNSKTSVFLDISSGFFSRELAHDSTMQFLRPVNDDIYKQFCLRCWSSNDYYQYGTVSYCWNQALANGFMDILSGFNTIGLDWYTWTNGSQRAFLAVNGQRKIENGYPNTFNAGIILMKFGNMPLKIRSIEVQQDHIATMRLVAVRKGYVGFMYDEMNDKYYRNLGDGELEIGPDVRR